VRRADISANETTASLPLLIIMRMPKPALSTSDIALVPMPPL
jgi:hypothetical protein